MPNYKKLLSTKVREDGRSQIIVRVDVSRTNRPQLKTGVWVLPDLFDAKKGGIDIPKRSKLNMPRYEEALRFMPRQSISLHQNATPLPLLT